VKHLFAALLALAACTDSPQPGLGGSTRTTKMEIPLSGPSPLDVLFVIDDSPAMAGKTERVAAHMDAFAAVMTSLVYAPDLHVGVITTDLGTSNATSLGTPIGAVGQGGCAGSGKAGNLVLNGAPVQGTYLADAPDEAGHQKNYTGDLGAALRQMANVGSGGCAYARPLEAARRALANNPANTGFLRPDAYLVVVHITAVDDCSFSGSTFLDGATTTDTSRCQITALASTETFATQLKATKTDPSKVLALEVTAGASPRLHAFAAAFPNRSAETSLLDSDPSLAFSLIAQLQKVTLGLPCWEVPLADVDAAAPGLQAECTAELSAKGESIALKRCAPGLGAPCYAIVEESACEQSGLSTKIEHVDGYRGLPATATIECLSEAP